MRPLALTLALVASVARADVATERAAWVEGPPPSLQSTSAPAGGEAFGLPVDKVLHASLSACLDLGLSAALVAGGVSKTGALLTAAGATLALGAAKELVWDFALGRGSPELADFVFDVLGTGAAFVSVALLTFVPEPKHRVSFRVRVGGGFAFVSGVF
jgi:hypothetical protein